MPLDASIPLQAMGPDWNRLISGVNTGMQMRSAVDDMKLRREQRRRLKERQQAISQITANPMPQDMRGMNSYIDQIFQVDPELGQAYQSLAEKRVNQKRTQIDRSRKVLLPAASEFSKFDDAQKAQNFTMWREMLKSQGAQIDPKWERGYTPEIGMQIDMIGNLYDQEQGRQDSKFGLTPIYGQGPRGSTEVMRMTTKGLERLPLPKGVSRVSRGVQKVDLGNKVAFFDKDGNFVGSEMKGVDPSQSPALKGAQAAAVQTATGKISEKEKKLAGKAAVSQTVQAMNSLYQELKQLPGGIVDVNKNSLSNVGARISASDIGQGLQNALGSKVQSTRNQIVMMRPTLIQYIRQATEMGARGLDSEKELEFYLSAATDPKRDLQANMNALKVLDNAYGLGLGLGKGKKIYKGPKGPVKQPNTRIVPLENKKPANLTNSEWKELKKLEAEFGR